MDKNYDHKKHEDEIYKQWEDSEAFTPPAGDELPEGQKTFTVIMPPPNANDPLHVGHAMFITVEDILVRFHRMLGEASLWLPGTDHAGIETQYVFEKKLAKTGKSRFDYDRETLYKMIWEYVEENSNTAVDQMKKLGASADWSRKKFTLDKEIVELVTDNFIELNNSGLIYKAERLVNFCTKCGTAYSELEIEYEEREDKLYTIDYGNGIKVATTRPETMLGDVAVAVHPEDSRYKVLIGKEVVLPISGRKIPVIADNMVDMEFGTGAVKITPTHDKNDWEVAERAGMDLASICREFTVIGENGKMNSNAGNYAGLSVAVAREKIIEDLAEKVTETKPITHSVGTCYRCHRVIEPLPRNQYFIRVKEMAKKVLTAMDAGEFEVLGSGHDKILRHWLTNLRDWNISRQIVWGIKIPAWNKGNEYKIQKESPGEDWQEETDTFDTWFSSGQWPFATLKTAKNGDFDKYYPTSVMETGYDILPFWVMRMLMLGIELTGKVPFKTVYLHGLVRDEKGRKMSKSVGNVINPLEMVDKYGADAIRMALVIGTTPGQDKAVGESTIRGMRNFANKIWNAGRFIVSMEDSEASGEKDEELFENLRTSIETMTLRLEDLKIGFAADWIYSWFWHTFCDRYIEISKKGLISKSAMLKMLKTNLVMLHPFVPFVTEAVWKEVFPEAGLLINQPWPK